MKDFVFAQFLSEFGWDEMARVTVNGYIASGHEPPDIDWENEEAAVDKMRELFIKN